MKQRQIHRNVTAYVHMSLARVKCVAYVENFSRSLTYILGHLIVVCCEMSFANVCYCHFLQK